MVGWLALSGVQICDYTHSHRHVCAKTAVKGVILASGSIKRGGVPTFPFITLSRRSQNLLIF